MSSIDLSTILFNGKKLPSLLYNASGVMCTSKDQLESVLSNNYTGAVVTKSCTLNYRKGNPEPRYHDSGDTILSSNWSINSMGIPNNGIDYYLNYHRDNHNSIKPYIVSVSGMSVNENMEIIKKIDSTMPKVDAIELNLSCPNIPNKPQLSYDFEGMDEALRKLISDRDNTQIPIGLKLSPYFDVSHFNSAAEVLEPYCNHLSFLTCSNSIGNGLLINPDTETTLIHPKNGLGGCGGDFMKPVALSNVYTFNRLLGDKIDIIGCGGVNHGDDVFNLVLAGAKAVQIGTLIARLGVNHFEVLHSQLKDRMVKNGYTNITEFRGKLKTINAAL